MPGRDLIEQPQRLVLVLAHHDFAQGPCGSKPGQACIELDEILQRNADSPESHGEPGRLVLRQHKTGTGLPQP